MNILIIENEFSYIETPFNYVNQVYYKGKLNFSVVAKSQDIRPLQSLEKYDFVFLDISLSKSSSLDGFGILKEIQEGEINVSKLIILTGNHDIEKKLKENNLGSYPVLTKPIDFNDLLKIFKQVSK